jgi:hypothetical protein
VFGFLGLYGLGLFVQEFKVALACNARGAQVVLDDEYGDGRILGDDHWTEHASSGVNEVIALLPDKAKTLSFQHAAQRLIRDGAKL